MPADLQEFHYMSVLRELELEAGILAGGQRKSTDRQQVGRVMEVFSLARQKLAQVRVGSGEKISLNLKASRAKQEEVERAIITNLRRLTGETVPDGEWPPRIPVGRTVERFTALAISLHSEAAGGDFAPSLAAAFEQAVSPALAWSLMVRLYDLPETLRTAAQAKLVERLMDETTPHSTEVALGGEAHRKVAFPSLRLVEAWFKLFATGKSWPLPAEVRTQLRRTLAARFRLPLGELDTQLWQELGELYVTTLAGSERARAVTRAGGQAAFMRERLALFAAGTQPGLQEFRLLTEHRPDVAVKRTFACEAENPPDRAAAGLEACGAAFWLARVSFGKHGHPHADAASARALLLLLRAAVMLRDQPDQAATCLRFAAGFATNPRYTRSGLVIDFQERLVAVYERKPLARRALVEQFRGRIAWQKWKAGNKASKVAALDHYMEALRLQEKTGQGLDAEGPIHFFPELVVLLGQDTSQGKRAEPDLATVDLITQRNYGIYFDIEKEERLINAGLKEYLDRQEAIEEARAEAGRVAQPPEDEAEDDAEDDVGPDIRLGALLKKSDYRKYQALIRQLWGA
jgi:hypothetical protein